MHRLKARRDEQGHRTVAGLRLEAALLGLGLGLAFATLTLMLIAPAANGQEATRDETRLGFGQPDGETAYGASEDSPDLAAGFGGSSFLGSREGGTSMAAVIGRFIFAVLLVVSLILLCVMVLRRYGLPRGAMGVAGPRLELRAQLHLGPRRTVYLVRVDGSEILLGTSGDGIRLLTELPGAWAVAAATTGTLAGTGAVAATGAMTVTGTGASASTPQAARAGSGRHRANTPPAHAGNPFAMTLGKLMNRGNGTSHEHEHASR
jgi:flagellar biogenesis protein FliO